MNISSKTCLLFTQSLYKVNVSSQYYYIKKRVE